HGREPTPDAQESPPSAVSSNLLSQRRSRQWSPDCAWFSCWEVYPGQRRKLLFTTERAVSLAARISTTKANDSGSSMTAELIATAWLKTTAVRTDCSTPACICCGSPQGTF